MQGLYVKVTNYNHNRKTTMLNKNSDSYKLYLAGIITENQYYDIMDPKPKVEVSDDGNDMLKRNLKDIKEYAELILSIMEDHDQLEEWMENKISVCRANISDVAHAFKYDKEEEAEDAASSCGGGGGSVRVISMESTEHGDDHYGVDDDSFINPPDEDDDESQDDLWDREKRLMDVAKPILSKVGKRIDNGQFRHPKWTDSGSIPELQHHHGSGDPDGMKDYLYDIASELPSDLGRELTIKINNI